MERNNQFGQKLTNYSLLELDREIKKPDLALVDPNDQQQQQQQLILT